MADGGGEEGLMTTLRAVPPGANSSPALVVLLHDLAIHHPIVGTGPISIGRSPSCDVQVDHPSISRKHAIVHVGEGYTIEDLGSANGTQVRGVSLVPNQPLAIALGEVVDLGATVLMIRNASGDSLVTHSTFEARLSEACASARNNAREFCVLRIHCGAVAASSLVQLAMRTRPSRDHLLARYGPGELELLALDLSAEQGAVLCAHLRKELGAARDDVRVGLAAYPADGRTPHALMFVANQGARPMVQGAAAAACAPVVQDAAMQELYRVAQKVAVGTISVLLLGETGVGKEIVARAVHQLSPRQGKPYVAINCAALSESLLESELFGHEKGAFTGAVARKLGLLESADGGTVFLDEVGELPLSLQVKLLRALEERQVLAVGGLKPRDINVRFVAATNRDLAEDAKAGRFREDLLYRLNGVTLDIPPLRERVSEIEPLAQSFAAEAAAALGRSAPSLSEGSLLLLHGYRWPGNIRELRNVIERAVLLAEDTIDIEHLPADKMQNITSPFPSVGLAESSSETSGEQGERERIKSALAQCGGNQTRAAKMLGISRRTMTRRLSHFGTARPIRDRDDS